MTVTAELSVPPDAFVFAPVLEADGDPVVDFERVVPVDAGATVLFWVEGGPDDAEELLADADAVDTVARLELYSDRALYEGAFAADDRAILGPLVDANVHLFEAIGTAEGWQFTLLCPDRPTLSDFVAAVTDRGIPVTLNRVAHRESDGAASISERQRDAVLSALDGGYFEVPRRSTIEDLAASEGISDTAFSQRLRRGLSAVLEDSRSGGLIGRTPRR